MKTLTLSDAEAKLVVDVLEQYWNWRFDEGEPDELWDPDQKAINRIWSVLEDKPPTPTCSDPAGIGCEHRPEDKDCACPCHDCTCGHPESMHLQEITGGARWCDWDKCPCIDYRPGEEEANGETNRTQGITNTSCRGRLPNKKGAR